MRDLSGSPTNFSAARSHDEDEWTRASAPEDDGASSRRSEHDYNLKGREHSLETEESEQSSLYVT